MQHPSQSELVAFRLPSDLLEPTRREAKRRGVSVSELVRASLRATVTSDQGEQMSDAGSPSHAVLCGRLRVAMGRLVIQCEPYGEAQQTFYREQLAKTFAGDLSAADEMARYMLWAGATGTISPPDALALAELLARRAALQGAPSAQKTLAGVLGVAAVRDRLLGLPDNAASFEGEALGLVSAAADQGDVDAERHLLAIAETLPRESVAHAQMKGAT